MCKTKFDQPFRLDMLNHCITGLTGRNEHQVTYWLEPHRNLSPRTWVSGVWGWRMQCVHGCNLLCRRVLLFLSREPKVGILGQLIRDVGFFSSFQLRSRRKWNLSKQCLAQSESVHSTACAKVIYRLALWTVCDSNAVLTDEQPQSLLVSGGWTLYKNGRFPWRGNSVTFLQLLSNSTLIP